MLWSIYACFRLYGCCMYMNVVITGLDIKHLVHMPVGHVVLKIYMPCKNFHVPCQYLYKPCKPYVHSWENKSVHRLKNHLPCRAHNHKSLCALRQDLHAPGMRARLNVEPWIIKVMERNHTFNYLLMHCYSPWVIPLYFGSVNLSLNSLGI